MTAATVYYAKPCVYCGATRRHDPSCPNHKPTVDRTEAGNT